MTTNSKEYAKAYYLANKDKFRAYAKKHSEKVKKQKYLSSPNPRLFDLREDYKTPTKTDFESIPKVEEIPYYKRYYAENRERVRAQQKAYREKKKRREQQRADYAANKEKIRAQQNARRAELRRYSQ